MYLKHAINTVDFFKAIDRCSGEVLLRTRENDILNLRSQLCRFVFAVALTDRNFFDKAIVECAFPSDYEILSDYLIM